MIANLRIRKVLMLLFLVVLFLQSCTKLLPHNQNTLSSIVKHNNFYAYKFDSEFINDKSWNEQLIAPAEWDIHCFGGVESPWNPLIIRYTDISQNIVLDIQLADRDVLWVSSNPHELVQINTNWVANNKGEFYSDSITSFLRVIDSLGNEITLISYENRTKEEMVGWVQKLEIVNKENSYNDPHKLDHKLRWIEVSFQ